MMFAERDEAGKIVGLYGRPQPGRAEEVLADDHPDVVAFRDRPEPPDPSVELDTALAALKGTNATVGDLIDVLQGSGGKGRIAGRPV